MTVVKGGAWCVVVQECEGFVMGAYVKGGRQAAAVGMGVVKEA